MKMIKIGSWRPSPATFIAGIVILLGFLLTEIHEMFLFLVLVGTFVPGILRELGWLKDQDELQRRAAWRAGYHAFLIGGSIIFVLVVLLRSGEWNLGDPAQIITFILAVIWRELMF